ncbi:alpha-2-macroglobulin [Polaribacter reichenbachii]|uniref:Alpha-2-macroglobulin n=1 Tax=Polaribacter reichenbachii TaxID=996801 RepID=A0A1B8TVX1_9FLAO|nr:MG2 domain-containing protein [Polaribacter reichenbachii]APZ45090.1 alpha-2-macroglobulin [Polaribacter reichenbachii]AUC18952.1 alpha-2-macroglobulin [Polaribacter reichenbachii]OBY63891.1 alpha-2-macroglobulin [Polaribacter reichenbachii]
MKKIITTLLMLILFSTISTAQNNYDNLWLQVEKFEVEDLPKSALKIVEEIYTKAEKENNSPQIIKSLFYKSKFALTLEEDAQLKIINSFKKQIASSNFPTKNILENILANLYWQYYNQNRYKFYNRTKTSHKINTDDFRTWDLDTLFKEINGYFNVSLGDEKALQKIEIEAFSDILHIQKTTKKYTPTLFDFLAQNALNFYKTSENSITRPAYKFIIDKPDFLSDVSIFKSLKIDSKDSLSLQLNALKTYQKLIKLHINSNQKEALANIDIDRLNFISQNSNFNDKENILLETLKLSQEKIKNHKASSLYAFEIAKIYKKNSQNNEALKICNSIINKFPDSFGAEKCIILKKKIKAKTLSIQSEKYIPINKNSRVLVIYKNIEKLFFTSYKINKKQQEIFNKTYKIEDRKAFLEKLDKHKTWQHQLRNEDDYLAHSTEIIVPKFTNGMFLIVASENENLDENLIYGTSIIQVTNLTLIENTFDGKYNFQVVDRNTGKPIENAVLDLQNKQRTSGQYFHKKLITDKNGFASFQGKNYSNNVDISVKTKNDAAIFGSYYFRNQTNKTITETDDEITIKPFIFTDRSIYRPGQTVYFKVIAIKKQGETSTVLKNEYVEITLSDVNNQIIKELNLKLNEFGSVAGQFTLPNNGLTGEFEIEVDESIEYDSKFYDSKNVYFDNNYKQISVEEYKRPKFETNFKPVTESYKINDSVTVNGFAKAFSGANITDAKVVYRVFRKVQYPSWYYWRNPNSYSSSQEITNGESITDHLGNFSIEFKALPDESVSKESLPIFSYEITADVTDVNGESRSATSIIKVGYHSLIASISVDAKIDKNEKKTILKIDTKNLNDEFVAAKGTLKIYKLQAPKNPLRKRPWAAPDYQDISETTFRTLFPNDSYLNDENDAKNWKKGQLVYSEKFDTETSKGHILKNTKNWISGKYLIILESKDKFGKEVKDEKIITLFSSKDEKVSDHQLFTISNIKANYRINDNVELQIGSASKDITVVVQIEKNHKIVDTKLIKLNNNTKTIQIPIYKEDIGGFAIKYHFVNYNYFKSGTLLINVPDPIKNNLKIATNIFRDKLQPGQEETWSFTIKDDKNDAIAAEVLASMYDASLDEFKTHNWNFNPRPNKPNYYSYSSSSAYKSFGNSNFYIKNNQRNYYNYPSIKNTTYNWFGFSFRNNKWVNQQYLNKIALKFEKENQESTFVKSGKFNGTIQGKITDKNKQPIAGANILVKGTQKVAITNFDGKYSIKSKKGDVLSFNYLGYQSIEIKTADFSILNVALAENLEDLDEIVVVGYGSQKKKSVTGAVSVISRDDIEQETILDEINAFSGRAAGTNTTDNNTSIILRGASSLNNNNAPLYIVDGVIVESLDINESEISEINVLKDAAATSIYGSRAANGVVIISTKEGQAKLDKALNQVKTRKNFKETAFFYPQLKTDKNGKVSFSFTMPEALTKWKLQLLAHTKNVKSATKTLQTVTQKELMVVPNAPRFLREKDTITLSAKITNLTNNQLSGFAKLILTNAISGKEINTELQNTNTNKNFIVDKDGNTNVSWQLVIAENIQAVQYKIVAKAGDFSDGEQNVLPVLSNRMLVTETIPMWVRSNQTKTFTLDKLKNHNSTTLKNHKLTLEITSNPVWYAIQSLPYLMEYPYECAEQTFSRYYANTLASFVANSNPKIQEVFNAWKSSDALLSNLEKNQELKSLIIQETPWLRDAQSETEQKKRIALLFDLNKMKNEQEKAIRKLEDIQMNSGGFPWFKGSKYESNFITQHIATGFGHLQKLGVTGFNSSTENMIKNAVNFLDGEIAEQYKKLLDKAEEVKQKAKTNKKGERGYKDYLSNNNLNYFTIQYLYMRSFYVDISMDDNLKTAFDYYQKQTITYWKDYNLYAKGQIALSLFRNNEKTITNKILKSLKENAIISDELGMYWKNNTAGYYYYQAPVETQALLIETFFEILDPDLHQDKQKTIDNLKIWLLKNKQTNRWKTTKATTEAVYAILLNGSNWIYSTELVDVKIGNQKIEPTKLDDVKVEAGTGYFKTSWNTDEIKSEMANVTISKKDNGIAWGGLYWQYFEDLDKITSAETPLKINKKLFLKVNSDTGKELKEITESTTVKVGDLITVRIELRSDRDMEFIHLKDLRASGIEPINVLSKYKWQDNLGYYQSTKDAATNFFFDRLPKGVYVFEYDVRVNNAGNFSNGISTIQSMYAPEFSSHSEGVRLKIEN